MAVAWISVLGALPATGCGHNCQETCHHVYGGSECAVPHPGQEETEAIKDCTNECEGALKNSGEVGTYDPFVPAADQGKVTLDNEEQAALWMECVWQLAPTNDEEQCAQLTPEEGYCAR